MFPSCRVQALHCGGISYCKAQALGSWASGVVAQGLQPEGSGVVCRGIDDPRHVESPWTRDRIYVPCIGRWILIHCTTREVPYSLLIWGRGVENGNPLQNSCLENPMDRGAWWATVNGVAELDMTEQLNKKAEEKHKEV